MTDTEIEEIEITPQMIEEGMVRIREEYATSNRLIAQMSWSDIAFILTAILRGRAQLRTEYGD